MMRKTVMALLVAPGVSLIITDVLKNTLILGEKLGSILKSS